ncbi:MAG: transcriptional regulator, partial [Acidobacteria bacterium]|nr:transcriptional regulator [Acidobacteriota bacterium]
MNHFTTALARGVVSASSLRDALAVSPSTLMRMVRAADSDLIRIGRGRATRYGWRQSWPGLSDSRFPLFQIGETGAPASAGTLVTLAARQAVWLPDGRVTDGLPVELFDIRPAGFLGRHFAARHPDLALPARLEDWSDHHVLLALSRRGEDLPGNLMIGEESFARWQAAVPPNVSRADYAALAEATLSGHPPGSSAAGERPKFAVLSEGRHVLVKFAAGA